MPKRTEFRLCSTREYASLHGISRQRVLALLDAGRIAGASWIGARWAIPRAARIAPPARSRAASPGLAQLTPLENALLAEFFERVHALAGARLERVVVFGSRARGGSRADSDLDVAVFVAGNEDRALRAGIYTAAAEAAAVLEGGDLALLQPSVIFAGSPRTSFVDIVEREGRAWTS
ncbi:MAG: nucleotidyltransferase domain-containing protein [Betaproteobacteria bacterium]|nr:nucleotidyltransferase domain-containing protein [Betaproteobacteria bacterium]